MKKCQNRTDLVTILTALVMLPMTASGGTGDFMGPVIVDKKEAPGSWKDRTISPVANMVYFEDPVIRNELRPAYIYHRISDDFITGGGDAFLAGRSSTDSDRPSSGDHQQGRIPLDQSRGR